MNLLCRTTSHRICRTLLHNLSLYTYPYTFTNNIPTTQFLCTLTPLESSLNKPQKLQDNPNYDNPNIFNNNTENDDDNPNASHNNIENDENFKKLCKIFAASNTNDIENALNEAKIDLTPELVGQVLKRYELAGLQAFKFFEWAKAHNRVDDYCYHRAIRCLGRIKRFDMSWTLVEEMRNKGIVTEHTFRAVITSYARKRDYGAIAAFDKMKDYGLEPCLDSFHVLLRSLCNNGKVIIAHQLFDKMINKEKRYAPNARTYGIMITAYSQIGNAIRVKWFYNDMRSKGVEADLAFYGLYMNALSRVNKLPEAVAVFEMVKKSKTMKPSAHMYTMLIRGYGFRREIEQAERVFREMDKDGVEKDTITYNAMIGSYCSVGYFTEANAMLEVMADMGIERDARSYNTILRYLSRYRKAIRASELFLKMTEQNVVPDETTYSMMVSMLCRCNRYKMAFQVWEYMTFKGFCPSKTTLSLLVEGLVKVKFELKAKHVVEEMFLKGLKPFQRTFKILMDRLTPAAREELFTRLCQRP